MTLGPNGKKSDQKTIQFETPSDPKVKPFIHRLVKTEMSGTKLYSCVEPANTEKIKRKLGTTMEFYTAISCPSLSKGKPLAFGMYLDSPNSNVTGLLMFCGLITKRDGKVFYLFRHLDIGKIENNYLFAISKRGIGIKYREYMLCSIKEARSLVVCILKIMLGHPDWKDAVVISTLDSCPNSLNVSAC